MREDLLLCCRKNPSQGSGPCLISTTKLMVYSKPSFSPHPCPKHLTVYGLSLPHSPVAFGPGRTNTTCWAKTFTAPSISPQLIRRSPGWLDVQSAWLGEIRKAFLSFFFFEESLSTFVVRLHSFLLTVRIDQVSRSPFPVNILNSASWKKSKLNLPPVPSQFPHAVYYIKETSYNFMPGSAVSGKDATTYSNQLF